LLIEGEVRFVDIEVESRRVLLPWKVEFGETQYSFSTLTESIVGFEESCVPTLVFWYGHAVLEYVSAQAPNFLGGTFSEHAIFTVRTWIMIDTEGILVGGIERKSGLTIFIVSAERKLLSRFDDVVDGLEELDEGGLGGITRSWHV
jgi:hypothetical protein